MHVAQSVQRFLANDMHKVKSRMRPAAVFYGQIFVP